MSMSASTTGTLQIKWDPKNLEIRTKSVEKTLEPIVTQVNDLSASFDCCLLLKGFASLLFFLFLLLFTFKPYHSCGN